jgi:hypothetical protein
MNRNVRRESLRRKIKESSILPQGLARGIYIQRDGDGDVLLTVKFPDTDTPIDGIAVALLDFYKREKQ